METKRLPSLTRTLAVGLIILAAVFGALLLFGLYFNFRSELRKSLNQRLETITTLAAFQQDGDALLGVQSENDADFQKIHDINSKIRESNPELRFVYTMRKNAQGEIYFVVDAGLPEEVGYSPFGTIYEEPSPTLEANFDTLTGTILEPDFYTDEYGTFLSGYAPIVDSSGKQVGVLGVDISANTILKQEKNYLFKIIYLYLAALFFLVIFGVVIAGYLAKPIVGLRNMANRISVGEYDARVKDIPRVRELAELAVDLNIMTANLGEKIEDLEEHVLERTAGLTKKTEQLQTASYIARQIAESQNLLSILNTVVNMLADRFGYYHAGIYLMNEVGDALFLQTASSDAGKRMVERGHVVRINAPGVVSYAASQKRPRIAFDTGADAAFFNNPDLPATRSQIALPLLMREKILGVLDIQSDQPQAFKTEDIDVLQTMVDQVAVAIENARLMNETQSALAQLEAMSTYRSRQAWSDHLKEQKHVFTYTPLGLRAEGAATEPADEQFKASIVLRGQTIGSIAMSKKDQNDWNKLDEDMINEVANQIGLAVDNLRLLEDAQHLARREQTIGELATRFSQALDIDSLLQTAAREMGQLPDVSDVSVYIGQMPEQTSPKRRTKRSTG